MAISPNAIIRTKDSWLGRCRLSAGVEGLFNTYVVSSGKESGEGGRNIAAYQCHWVSCFHVINFRMRPKLGWVVISWDEPRKQLLCSIKQGSQRGAHNVHLRNITRISGGEWSPKTQGTSIKTQPARHLVGQSINIHVYPSKPEGVFVPEGANLGRCVLHSHSLQIRNVDVFSLSPMLLAHNSFPHIWQSGNVISLSFSKPKDVFFKQRAEPNSKDDRWMLNDFQTRSMNNFRCKMDELVRTKCKNS